MNLKVSHILQTCILVATMSLFSCKTTRVVKDRHDNTKYYNLNYGEGKRNIYDLFVPNELTDSALVVVVHGGGWRIGDKSHIRQAQRKLLKNGIASVALNYPLADNKTTYKHQVDAIDKLVRKLKDSIADREIILLGESSGGHISLLYAYQNPDKISRVISFAGPTDFYSSGLTDKKFYQWYTKKTFSRAVGDKYKLGEEIPASFREASPLSQVSNVPTLMIHGTCDMLVNKNQSLSLDSVLTQKGIPHKLVMLKGANHTPRFMPWWSKKIYKEVVDFIKMPVKEIPTN